MDPEVRYYLLHSEPTTGPPRRLRIEFEDKSYCVLLFNEFATDIAQTLVKDLDLRGKQFTESENTLVLNLNEDKYKSLEQDIKIEPSIVKPQNGFVYFSADRLYLYTKTTSTKQMMPPECAYVIIGKQNLLRCLPITKIELLGKSAPTPFISDEFGDSYNDSFKLEPRIVESIPQTVFDAVNNIMELAKKCYAMRTKESIIAAAEKYRKAFHYCHKYYPDDLNEEDLRVATDLKIKSLLNLALVSLKTGDPAWYRRAIESCDVVLGMPELKSRTVDLAKAYYRRGYAYLLLGDEDTAEEDLKKSLEIFEDESTVRAIRECEEKRLNRKQKLREKLRNI